VISTPDADQRGSSRGVGRLLAVIAMVAVSALNLWLSTATADSVRSLIPIWLTLGLAGLLGAFLLSRNLPWGTWLSITVVLGTVIMLGVYASIFAASFEELGDRTPPPASSR
jgi:hypothetical protein